MRDRKLFQPPHEPAGTIEQVELVLLAAVDIERLSFLSRTYEERQRKPDDLEAQEGQRAIAVHALENLATSDTGIAMLRRTLREQIKRVSDGLDPMNVIRDERLNRTIPTNAWNTILSATEASVLQGEEV